jgi:hypothetical protein
MPFARPILGCPILGCPMSRYAGDSPILTNNVPMPPKVLSWGKYIPLLKYAITVGLRSIYIL